MVSAIMCYFIGDNLRNFYKIKERPKDFRIASQILLIVGVLGFRYVPIFKGYLYKCYNRDVDPETVGQTAKSIEGCIKKTKDCIQSDNKLLKKIVRRSIVQVPEADAIYTLFENLFTNCSKGQLGATWTAIIGIPIILTPYVGIQLLTIASNMKNKHKKWSSSIIMTFLSVTLVATFMLSDNQKALNCIGGIKCIKINDMNELNALNVTCNTTHISNDLFNGTSSEIVIGTKCEANNLFRVGLNLIQIVTMLILGIVVAACRSGAAKK